MHQTLQLEKFEGVDFKYGNGFFELQSENIQIKQFCHKCKYFSFLHGSLHIEKFKSTDFENGNSFFQIPAKKYPNTKFSLKTQVFFFLFKKGFF